MSTTSHNTHKFFESLTHTAIDYNHACQILSPYLPLLDELQHTPQDPIWHAEGNVAIHTAMVCEELEEAIANGSAACSHDPKLRQATRLAALLHDIAKPLVTREDHTPERTRIIAPRHAPKGASYIAYRLLDAGCPRELLHTTLDIVRLHHDPKFLIIKDKAEGAYRALARQASIKGLYDLEMADMRGRRCDDRQAQIDIIELFALACKDYGVWEEEQAAAWEAQFQEHITTELQSHHLEPLRIERAIAEGRQAHAQGIIFTPHEAVSRELARDSRFCEVVLAMGPSGSGKSTTLKTYASDIRPTTWISLDDIRAELTGDPSDQSKNNEVVALSRERLRDALRAEHQILFDATSLIQDHRSTILSLAHDYNALTTLMLMHTAPHVCQANNKARERSVPAHILSKQIDTLSWPTTQEAHRVHIHRMS